MKKIALTLFLAALTAIACKEVPVFNVELNKDKLVLEVGQIEVLTATVNPSGATEKAVSWSSSNNSVVLVDKGKLTAVAPGNATITVTTKEGNKTATCAVKVFIPYPDEPEMVFVEGGTFTMGCTDEQEDDCWDDETPVHQVTLSSFQIGKYPVTQNQWEALMGENPSFFPKNNCPVENVNWDDIHNYINKLNAATGKKYRLPTEAEWEFAARGGNQSKGYKYSGSDNHHDVVQQGYGPFVVGQKLPNELGIYDMSGNVWECCSDWYGAYSAEAQVNPQGPSTGTGHVVRGGAWNSVPANIVFSVSCRACLLPDTRSSLTGFRLVLE